jgi:DNA-directed RNA polymerase III subunit RPC1
MKGIANKQDNCETCGQNMQECVGHFGHLRLALPVFHIGYLRSVISVLQNICKSCSRVLLTEPDRRSYLKRLRNPNIDGVTRNLILKSLNATCKKINVCPWCGDNNGAIKKMSPLRLVHERYKESRKSQRPDIEQFRNTFDLAVEMNSELKFHVPKAQDDLDPVRVKNLFEAISDEDCEVLGLNPLHGRPEHFIWEALPVPPVCIRPSVGQDGASNEDDITVLLSDIVTVNTRIKNTLREGGDMKLLMEHWDFLQLQTAMYVNADLPGVNNPPAMLQRIKRGFCQRLKGKQGRFRGNLSGKRVDFSGRTVISPDPNLKINEVAVPVHIAKILTYPEQVFVHNIDRLREAVRRGTEIHPGATYVRKASSQTKLYLKYGNKDQIAKDLEIGDVVERHICDGDIVLFNRQPSLHKLSIMAHFVKVRPWRTFRLNECVCTPYNADFDGDEMNLHVPQNEEARAEAMELMGVQHNLVTPRNGEPLIAAIQDFITASYLLSNKDVFLDRAQFSQICAYMTDANLYVEIPPPAMLKPFVRWTGKQVFSMLLRCNSSSPVKVNLSTKNRSFEKSSKVPEMDPNDGWVVIENSEILCGSIDKSIVGAESKNSIFYTILRDYGPGETVAAMNRLAKVCARWLGGRGFSIGIDDVQAGESLYKKKELMVAEGYRECDERILESKMGKMPNQPGCDQEQTLESHIAGILSKIRDEMGQTCLTDLNRYNAPLIMSVCGSKGSKINVSQMVACVGQQIISGQRIPNGFADRSLPHFEKNSKVPAAKGFVRNSFYSGLSPSEFFFHAVSGREGLVDTAVKTAETGYMQRRLMKALEDLTTHYDSSVRNSTGGMVQFIYGDDGLDPTNMELGKQPVNLARLLFHVQQLHPSAGEVGLLPEQIEDFIQQFQAECFKKTSAQFTEQLASFLKEAVLAKLVDIRAKHSVMSEPSDTPLDILASLASSSSPARKKKSTRNVTPVEDKRPQRIIDNLFKITYVQLEEFVRIAKQKFSKARIEPGTAVGAVGAQSIGEPGTQMTLKTFHFAGVASMNITLGVPRIKEIINAARNISTPIITAQLDGDTDPEKKGALPFARLVKGRIEKSVLSDVAEFVEQDVGAEKGHSCVSVRLDFDAIGKLQLEVDLDTIRQSILHTPKLKLDAGHVQKRGLNRLVVLPPTQDKDKDTEKQYELSVALAQLKRAIPKVIVKGIASVNRAVISQDGGSLKLLVEGTGLREVMNTEGVKGEETTSNHVLEVFKVLGIEAARATIIKEIEYTMGSHGMTIDPRHVMLLADLMTYKGEVLGITRFGIAKMKDSVLMLASFEKTTDHLFDAAFYSKTDKIDGVSECIIMGVPMGIGTGLFTVLQQYVLCEGLTFFRTDDEVPKERPLVFDI